MRKNLTHAVVEGLKPPTDRPQVDVWDSRKPGFAIRVSKNGTKTWVLRYRQHGRKQRLTLGRFPEVSVHEARKKATSFLGDVAEGQDPAAERAEEKTAETFGQLAEVYIKHHAIPKKAPRSVRDDQRMLKADLLPRWQNRKLADIRRKDVIALLDAIVERGAPVHANRVRALCSKMFNVAIKRDLMEANPAHGTDRPAAERSRERRLNDDELRCLWAVLESEPLHVAALFKLALLTAARRTELCRMAWSELLDKGWWTVPSDRSKGGQEHRIPLSASALALLDQLRANTDGAYVFPGQRAGQPMTFNHDWIERIRARAGLAEPWLFHDLRRTVASGMTAIGIPRLTVSKILGHAEGGAVTWRYDRHSYDGEKRDAITRWDRHLARVVSGQSNVVELRA